MSEAVQSDGRFHFREHAKLLIGIVAAALLLAVGAYFALPKLLGVSITPIMVTRGDITQTIVASGRVESPSRVALGSQITGAVLKVLAKEGEQVSAGAPLIVLDDGDARGLAGQARASMRQAEGKLDQFATLTLPAAKQSQAEAEATSLNAERHLDRIQTLASRGYATRAQLEDGQQGFDVARTQVRAAQLRVASASAGGSDVLLAEAALEQARAAFRSSEARLRLTVIEAPIDGVVISRDVEPGAIVQPGTTLMMLAPQGEKRLLVQVDERNIGLIKTGQPALASADAYPGERFKATLTVISPSVDSQRGSVEVKLLVTDPPQYLKEDMTVSVDIEVAHHEDTLVLSADALRDVEGSMARVLVIVADHAEDRPVTLGVRGDGVVEVLSGLKAGDAAVPAKETRILVGQRVRQAKDVAIVAKAAAADMPAP